MNTYDNEQLFTDKYGDILMRQVAASFFDKFGIERVTDRETQIAGVDYYFWKQADGRTIKQKADIKLDFYENNNLALETSQQYSGIGEQSWLWHDGEIWIVYFKLYKRRAYIYKLSDLQEFAKTDLFKNRKSMKTIRTVNGKAGTFKNFKLDELPLHHTVNIDLMYNPFEQDPLLKTKQSLPDYKIYANEV